MYHNNDNNNNTNTIVSYHIMLYQVRAQAQAAELGQRCQSLAEALA